MEAVVDTSLVHSWGRSRKVKEFISSLNPGYSLPETRKIKEIMVQKKADLQLNLKEHLTKYCVAGSLSADGWSAHSKSYFALLLHFTNFQSSEQVSCKFLIIFQLINIIR